MGVAIRKKDGVCYVFVNHMGRRKAKRIGTDRKAAEQVKRVPEAKLALGDLGVMEDTAANRPEFETYANAWLRESTRKWNARGRRWMDIKESCASICGRSLG
jgi:integrase